MADDQESFLALEACVEILPGQYFDAETGLHQNHHRDYSPGDGRYLQSDPIGLDGGLSTYGYVGQIPLRYSDPTGLYAPFVHREITTAAVAGTRSCSTFNGLPSSVAAVDHEPSFLKSQSKKNAHWHGMSEEGVDGREAERRYDEYIEKQLSRCNKEGLAKALHAAQDSTAPGHRFASYGGLLDISLMHILQDYFPSPWIKMYAVNYSQTLLNKFRDKCPCACK
jgi:RHS repeat-associated protein